MAELIRKSAEDYKQMLLQLLPQGRAWDKDEGSNINSLIEGLAQEFARLDDYAFDFLDEVNPATTTQLLENWEAATGSGELCNQGLNASFEERRAAVIAQLVATGGASIGYFQQIALALGYPISVTDKLLPFLAGQGRAGDRCQDDSWRYNWIVRAPEQTIRYFRAGSGRAGEPLTTFGNTLLECVLKNLKPAHTNIIFTYQTVNQLLSAYATASGNVNAGVSLINHFSANVSALANVVLGDAWTPEQLSSTYMWFNSQDFTSAGDITTWTDRINSIVAEQNGAGVKPESVLNQMNSYPVVRFAANESLEIPYRQEFDLNFNEMEITVMADVTSGGGRIVDRNQFNLDSKVEVDTLVESYHSNKLDEDNGSNGFIASNLWDVTEYDGTLYATAELGLHKRNNDGTWTDVAPGTAPRGRALVYNNKLYAISSTVNKMYVWDGTTMNEYANTESTPFGNLYDFVLKGTEFFVIDHGSSSRYSKLLKFDPATNVWSTEYTWPTFDDKPVSIEVHNNNIYVATETGSGGDIFIWNGTTMTAQNVSFYRPRILFSHGGTVWTIATNTYKLANEANGWTPIDGPAVGGFTGKDMVVMKNGTELWIIDAANGTIYPYLLDGTNLNVNNILPSFTMTSHSLGIQVAGYIKLDEESLRLPGNSFVFDLERRRVAKSNETLTKAILHYQIRNDEINVFVNGVQVVDVNYSLEQFRDPLEIIETIDITNGTLVSIVNDILTINPTNDLPSNSRINVIIPDGVVENWTGIDDWDFEVT